MKNKASKNNLVEALLGIFATGSVCFWASLLVISTASLILKVPISASHFWIAAILTSLFLPWYAVKTAKYGMRSLLLAALLFISLFASTIFISGKVTDISYDGQAYHQEAIIQLVRGWNPVYMILDGEATANLERWLNHYPKGVWYMAASIYNLTGNIESGKALALFTPIVAFAFCLWGMWRIKLNIILKIIISIVFAANPVAIYQSLSYYVDGILVSMLLSLVFVGVRIATTKDKTAFWPMLFVIVILVNIKLSSVVFTGILLGGIILYFWTRDMLKISLLAIKFSFLGVFIGVFIVGYNPYVTNFVLKGHPLYPSMGKDAYDYVPGNTPQNYWHMAPPVRLASSIFSYSSLARGEGRNAQLKIPFTVTSDELQVFRETNAKTGGFGPLFGGIFLTATVFGFLYLVLSGFAKETKYIVLGGLALILGSASIVATSSVARYVPYVWWAPCILLLYFLYEKGWPAKILGTILAGLIILNSLVVAYIYYPYNIAQSGKVKEGLQELAINQNGEPLVIDVAQFGSTKIKLKEYGISYSEVPTNTKCKSRKRLLVHNITDICEL